MVIYQSTTMKHDTHVQVNVTCDRGSEEYLLQSIGEPLQPLQVKEMFGTSLFYADSIALPGGDLLGTNSSVIVKTQIENYRGIL